MKKGKCVSWGKSADPVQLLLFVSFNALGGGCAEKILYLVMGLFTAARGGATSVPNPSARTQLQVQPRW